MAFTSNIQEFLSPTLSGQLVTSYRLLVAIELALKDGNCTAADGHDIPTMLQVAANLPGTAPMISAQLNSFSAALRSDLGTITCQGLNGRPKPVPPNKYPYIRYNRYAGDWGGIDETAPVAITSLENTCRGLCVFLAAHGAAIGVRL